MRQALQFAESRNTDATLVAWTLVKGIPGAIPTPEPWYRRQGGAEAGAGRHCQRCLNGRPSVAAGRCSLPHRFQRSTMRWLTTEKSGARSRYAIFPAAEETTNSQCPLANLVADSNLGCDNDREKRNDKKIAR